MSIEGKVTMIGIIGGTGLYSLGIFDSFEEKAIDTPFGLPSAPIVVGRYKSAQLAFLARHGSKHELLPSEINYRANIWALKMVGVKRIVSISAVGSLVDEVAPGSLALAEQYFDWTRGTRQGTFFGNGLVAHVSTAEPTCLELGDRLVVAARKSGCDLQRSKTYSCVEGPRLGTRAESQFLKSAGCHLVGMTNVPEVFLSREAQLCYCSLCIVTDYDCWLDDPAKHVTVSKVMELYCRQLERVQSVIRELVGTEIDARDCTCSNQLCEAILSKPEQMSAEARKLLEFLKS